MNPTDNSAIDEFRRLVSTLPQEQIEEVVKMILRRGYDLGYKVAISERQREVANSKNSANKEEKGKARKEWEFAQALKPYRLNIKEHRSNKTLAAHIKDKYKLKVRTKTIENWISDFCRE